MDFNIKKIAKLAKIQFNTQEEKILENNIKDMIKMINKLDDVNLKIKDDKSLDMILLDSMLSMQYRDDNERKFTNHQELIKNVPQLISDYIVVPKIID